MLTAGAGEIREERIADQMGYWEQNGFAGMVPSIHLPTTHSRDDLIHVWLKVPAGRRIDVERAPDGNGWQLVLPPGTHADRTEYFRASGPPPSEAALYLDSTAVDKRDWTVADVRGTRVLADGRQRFHVYRPINGELHAPLVGWSWPRGDADAQRRATDALIAHCRGARRPIDQPPMDARALARLRRLNDCAHCHRKDMPQLDRQQSERVLERGTDNLGFFGPTAVLSDSCVVANHRPEDVNDEDPYVQVRCGDKPAELIRKDSFERYDCANGRVPIGYRDVRAGLAAGHEYTRRVCESRRWLFERMTERARRVYADGFAACGLGGRSRER
jgi:hypothetical protein